MNTNQLTFTRFLAAISIVLYHFGGQVYPLNIPMIGNIISKADTAVSYFYLLSGFVMIVAYWRRYEFIDFKSYIKNRAARILPLYYLAFLLMLLYYFIRIKVLHMPAPYIPTLIDAVLNMLLLQSWVPGKALTVNTAAWSLSVEAFFYLIFPFMFNQVYKKLRPAATAVLVIAFFVVSQVAFYYALKNYYQPFGAYSLFSPLMHVNEFFAGNLLGMVFVMKQKSTFSNYSLLTIGIAILCALGLSHPIEGLSYHNGLFIIIFAPLIYFMALDNGFLARLFRKKMLVYLGEISFGIYLLQFPIYFFFTATLTFFHHKINQPLFYVFLLTLIAASAFSYNYIEKPLREKIRSL